MIENTELQKRKRGGRFGFCSLGNLQLLSCCNYYRVTGLTTCSGQFYAWWSTSQCWNCSFLRSHPYSVLTLHRSHFFCLNHSQGVQTNSMTYETNGPLEPIVCLTSCVVNKQHFVLLFVLPRTTIIGNIRSLRFSTYQWVGCVCGTFIFAWQQLIFNFCR